MENFHFFWVSFKILELRRRKERFWKISSLSSTVKLLESYIQLFLNTWQFKVNGLFKILNGLAHSLYSAAQNTLIRFLNYTSVPL